MRAFTTIVPSDLRADWRWLAAATAAVMLLVEIPYLVAHAQIARGLVFVGMFWSPHDFAQYAAAMREGAASASWLVHDHLSGEPHAPALMYTFYVALGKASVMLGMQPEATFATSRRRGVRQAGPGAS